MTTSLSRLWDKFKSRRYRTAFVESHLSSTIAAQIQTMRFDREMTQADLAELCGMKQSRISVLEDPDNASLSISTLKRIAAAFDVALIVRFVPFSLLGRWAAETGGRKFSVASFDTDATPRVGLGLVIYSGSGTEDVRIYQENDATSETAAFLEKHVAQTSARVLH